MGMLIWKLEEIIVLRFFLVMRRLRRDIFYKSYLNKKKHLIFMLNKKGAFIFLISLLFIFLISNSVYAQVICSDSEGYSEDYFSKGQIIAVDDLGGRLVVEDICFSDYLSKLPLELKQNIQDNPNILMESFCPTSPPDNLRDGSVFIKEYECPNGCFDGACIKDTFSSKGPICKIGGKEVSCSEMPFGEFFPIFAFFIVLIILSLFWIYLSLVYFAIAKKNKQSSPGIAWIPGFGPLIIAYKASKMHWWPWLMLIGIPFTIILIGFIPLIIFLVFTIIWQWKMLESVDRPGWWVLLNFIPFVGGIIYLSLLGVVAWGKNE
jgi:uncharacterized membrane protein YhaH (DUF805 family)